MEQLIEHSVTNNHSRHEQPAELKREAQRGSWFDEQYYYYSDSL